MDLKITSKRFPKTRNSISLFTRKVKLMKWIKEEQKESLVDEDMIKELEEELEKLRIHD